MTPSLNVDPFSASLQSVSQTQPSILGFDPIAIYGGLFRNRWWMLTVIICTLLIGVGLTLLTTPIYRAVASVQINQESEKVLGTENGEDVSSLMDAERFLQTQLDILRSRTLAVAVAESGKLFDNPSFLEAMDADPVTSPGPRQTLEEAKREQVIKIIRDNLTLELPIDSRVVQIGFESSDPRLASSIANGFADSFIRSNLQRRFNSSSYSRDFLREQLDAAQLKLARSERAAVNYAQSTDIVDTSGGGVDANRTKSSLTVDSLVALNQKLSLAVAERINAEARWNRVRDTPVLSLPEVQNNEAVQQLLKERAGLQALYREEAERRKEDYPSMLRAEARISQLDREIQQIAGSIRKGIQSEFEISRNAEQALRTQVSNFRKQSQSEQTDSIQLSILQREVETNREQYDFLLKRYNELTAEAGVQSNNLSIVDRAISPSKPSSPNIILNIIGTLGLGIVLAIVFVFLRENLFSMIRTPDDAARTLHLPVLGAVPDGGTSMDVIEELRDSKSNFAEAIISIRTSLLLSSRSGLVRSMAFTSTQPGEGKSTTCYALAYALVKSGKRVLIIDADLRRPNQHRIAGLSNKVGLSDILAKSAGIELAEAVQNDATSGVDFITSGPIPPNPSELINTESLSVLISDCLERYDCVMVDCPPVLGIADAIVVSSAVEGVVYIAESGRNHSRGASTSVQRLQSNGASIIGVIVTRFVADSTGYGNAYTYAYEYSQR
jgi:succinoglycan biosynthesis transport protein ExoP